MIEKRIVKCGFVLLIVVLLLSLNLPEYIEIYCEEEKLDVEVQEEVADQKITIHRENIGMPRSQSVFSMEVADVEYIAWEKEMQKKASERRSEEKPGGCLTASIGVFQGPSGKETWYNLPMAGIIDVMRHQGYDEAHYPYWIREDGAKMLGPYVMCAANLEARPRGSIIQTSLGEAIVCDTGGFATYNAMQIDIATNW